MLAAIALQPYLDRRFHLLRDGGDFLRNAYHTHVGNLARITSGKYPGIPIPDHNVSYANTKNRGKTYFPSNILKVRVRTKSNYKPLQVLAPLNMPYKRNYWVGGRKTYNRLRNNPFAGGTPFQRARLRSQLRPRGTVISSGNMRKITWQKPVELKFKDVPHTPEPLDIATSTVCFSVISPFATGNTNQTRIGSKAFISSLYIKGFVDQDAGANSNAQRVRCILFIDHQSNGNVATLAEVLDLGAQDKMNSYRKLENTRRFTVLYDKIMDMQHPSGAGNTASNTFTQTFREIKIFKKFNKPIAVRFQDGDTAGLDADILDNNILMAVFCNTNTGNYGWEARIRYTD